MLSYEWQHRLNEWRHSPCLMKPVSFGMLIVMVVFWLVTMIINLPTWVLGFLVAPIMSRGTMLIEFLYPLPIARWGHLLILRWSQPKVPADDKASNYHTRTLEQRIEVVKGRVFIHPIPQLLDNLGYLVVCLEAVPKYPCTIAHGPIVAFVVDCGDADTVLEQTQLIHETHYAKQGYPSIQVQMVLSTHKHHDHTAGNGPIRRHPKLGQYIDHIVGGAVEQVPGCNLPVSDGDRIKLPALGGNDMNDAVYVEVVAVPAHTRGSVAYLLRAKNNSTEPPPNNNNSSDSMDALLFPPPCFAFTGDTMFSGGGGVPFEAGSDAEIDQGAYKDNAHGAIRAGVGSHAVERCFLEILIRGTMSSTSSDSSYVSPVVDPLRIQNQFLIFPGHEYTTELLSRQFMAPANNNAGNDANKWKNFPPNVFFETVSELYVSMHRRSLPQATGKVLAAAPTTLRKELSINPHFRSLTRRAELVVHAIRLWDAYFCKPKGPRDEEKAVMRIRQEARDKQRKKKNSASLSRRLQQQKEAAADKTPSTENSWTMNTNDASQSVFTTIYTTDLDDVIEDLARGRIRPVEAAQKLQDMKETLKEPVIRRRPIPGTLPSERVVFKGLIGFALLGSRPSAMTLSDSQTMKLPPPIVRDMHCILVSKKRLVTVLGHLGYLDDNAEGQNLLDMIDGLWQEAHDYTIGTSLELATSGSSDSNYNAVNTKDPEGHKVAGGDIELEYVNDLVQLGTLKWILYGFPAKQPSWFSKFCMPCGMTEAEEELERRQDIEAQMDHPVKTSRMKRRHGELVRHDVMNCKLCVSTTGCICEQDEDVTSDNAREVEEGNDDDSSSSAPSDEEDDTIPEKLPMPAAIGNNDQVLQTLSGLTSTRAVKSMGSARTRSHLSATTAASARTATSARTGGTSFNSPTQLSLLSSTNFSTTAGDDDESAVSYVDSSGESAVEVATLASLLTGEMAVAEEKIVT